MAKWYPRKQEYEKYVHWDHKHPTKYTRNIVLQNEHMDVLLMCWPAGSNSSIHDHQDSSCFVTVVAGTVHEVQFAMPKFDNKFIEEENKCPTGAIGHTSQLKVINQAVISDETQMTSTYANNDIGLHRVENRSDKPAYTLHIYAPGLRKMRIFKEVKDGGVVSVATVPIMSSNGEKTGEWQEATDPDGVIDVEAWNSVDISEL